jgi:hypothetical protein|tara:strand:- start:991 stop:1653 length:663 start_codon:yes stop_codon:yes gene_type:complete
MAKTFYVKEKSGDYTKIHFFKSEKEALKYGISEWPDFDMYGDPDDEDDSYDDDNDAWFVGSSIDFKKGVLFSFEEGMSHVREMDEDAAREYVKEEVGDYGAAIFFDSFKKGMYGYLGNGADGKGYKWDWDGNGINESKRNVPTFEEFTTSNITEAKSDGTISDDEDELMDDLMGTIEATIDDLIADSREKAYEIGGSFRGPGNVDRIKKLLVAKVKKMKL